MPIRDQYRKMKEMRAKVDSGEETDPKVIERVRRFYAYKERYAEKKRKETAHKDAKVRLEGIEAEEYPDEIDAPPPPPPEPEVHRVVVPDFAEMSRLSQLQKTKLLECLMELGGRQYETLKLYEPLPIQKQFHDSEAHIRIIRGGNRSGKTTASIVELCWALTGQHPIKDRYPSENLRTIIVAKDNDKIGQVIWRLMGRPGAFKLVNDPVTGLPRLERPGDREAGLKMRDAPPLIPRRMIKAIQWVSLKAMQPKTLILTNGSECSFYSSEADPFSIQGTKLHLAIFDEEVKNEGWFPEAIARLVDYGGRFVWSATPQTGTQKLYDLGQKAMEERENRTITIEGQVIEASEDRPLIEEFLITIRDNPYLTEEDKKLFILSLDDEDQIKIRVEGEHAIAGFKIYAPYFFPRGIHSVEPFPIPHDWTRFASIDPGIQVGAVIFGACPPKTRPKGSELSDVLFGDFIYIYDEIYLKRCDATKMALEMKAHIADQVIYEILIDHHGGQLTEIGSGKTPEQQYKDAFKAARVPVPVVGRYFTWGSDDLNGGILRIKECLRIRADGTPKIRIVAGSAPNLVSALNRYQWKVVNGQVTDKPLARNCDAADCLRYLVMHPGVRYHQLEVKRRDLKNSYEQFKEFQRRDLKRKKKKEGISL